MACMEHECLRCHTVWFDNCVSGQCHQCGSIDVANLFDEKPLWEEPWNSDD